MAIGKSILIVIVGLVSCTANAPTMAPQSYVVPPAPEMTMPVSEPHLKRNEIRRRFRDVDHSLKELKELLDYGPEK